MSPPQTTHPVDTQPVAPQTTPPDSPSWAQERDAVHVWTALTKVNETLGEMKAGIAGLHTSTEGLRGDVTKFKSHLSRATWSVAGAAAIIGGLFWFSSHIWDSILKPGLAHAVAEQVGPIIDKRVKEAQAETAPRSQPAPRSK